MEESPVVKRGRNFRLLDADELTELLNFLTEYLPESLKFQQTVLTYIRDKVWEFHFYVANEWPGVPVCLHFPGMTLSTHGFLYESFGVFCPGDQLEFLRLVREEDILIDWTKPLYINFVHCNIADTLVDLYKGVGIVKQVPGDVWVCENLEAALEAENDHVDTKLDVQVLPLRAEHAEGIHDLYPANTMECRELFLRLINTLEAAGVFVDGALAAWMVQSYYGAMFSMQTKPEYRRKGYGTKLARYLIKRIIDRGYNPFVVIRPENEASQSLYSKLGFKKLYQMTRLIFKPYPSELWEDTEVDADYAISLISDMPIEATTKEENDAALQGHDEATITVESLDNEGEDTIMDQTDSPDEAVECIVQEPEDLSCSHDPQDSEEVVVETQELEGKDDLMQDIVLESIEEASQESTDQQESTAENN